MTDSPNTKEKSYCIYNLSSPWSTCKFEYDIAFLTNNVNVTVSGIGAVVKVVDYHLCGWGSILNKKLQLSHSHFKQGLVTVLHVF